MRKPNVVKYLMAIALIMLVTPALCQDNTRTKIRVVAGDEASTPNKSKDEFIAQAMSRGDVKLVYSPALPLLTPE